VVDSLLVVLIEHFSLAVMVESLRADIGRSRCLQKGVGHFERKFQGDWDLAHQRLLASEK